MCGIVRRDLLHKLCESDKIEPLSFFLKTSVIHFVVHVHKISVLLMSYRRS